MGPRLPPTRSPSELSQSSAPNHPGAQAFLPSCNVPQRAWCVCRAEGCAGSGEGLCVTVGGSAAGFPTGKQPSPSPPLIGILGRNRRQDAPGREAAPARISLQGGAVMTHPFPFPRFLVCISPPGHMAAGAVIHRPCPDTRPLRIQHASQGRSCALGFGGAQALARPPRSPESGLHPVPVPGPCPMPSALEAGRLPLPALPARGGEGGGQRRGCDSSRPDQCRLQPRFSARSQLDLFVWDGGGGSGLIVAGVDPLLTPPALYPPRRASPPSTASCCPGSWSSQELALFTSPGTYSPHPSRSRRAPRGSPNLLLEPALAVPAWEGT